MLDLGEVVRGIINEWKNIIIKFNSFITNLIIKYVLQFQ